MKSYLFISLTFVLQTAHAQPVNPNIYSSPIWVQIDDDNDKMVDIKLMSLVKCDAVSKAIDDRRVIHGEVRYVSISKELKGNVTYNKNKKSLKVTLFDSDYKVLTTTPTDTYKLSKPDSDILIGLRAMEGSSGWGHLSWKHESQDGFIASKGNAPVMLSNCIAVDNTRAHQR